MTKTRKHYSAEEKAPILKRYLVEKMALSDLCDEFGLQPSQVYRWQQQLFERAPEAFRRTSGRGGAAKERKIAALEEKLTRKNEVIAELMEDNVRAKKAAGEL